MSGRETSAAGPPQGARPLGGERRAAPLRGEGTSAAQPVDDLLTPFVFERAAVRGGLVTLGPAARAILDCNPYPIALSRALCELLCASALLSSTLKFEGSLIVQLAADGPVRLAVVECTDALDLRATAQWDRHAVAALPDDATLAALAGGPAQGRLTITLDPRGRGSLYQGIVALQATGVGGLIEHYLASSEQLQSRLLLEARGDAAAGLLLQRLPASSAADDAHWARLTARVDAVAGDALFTGTAHVATLAALFPADDLRLFQSRPVQARCSCSPERVANALRIAGRREIEAALAADGSVEVRCEFCNRTYTFDAAAAREVFAAQAPSHTRH
jgi:molecular chaperone Hsp33